MGFSRQEYWHGLPFPSPGDRLHPGTEPVSPAFQVGSLTLSLQGSPKLTTLQFKKEFQGFPGDSVVKDPPVTAGDTGLTPDPESSHVPQSTWVHVPQLLKAYGSNCPLLCQNTKDLVGA